jgi:hypothetical protein
MIPRFLAYEAARTTLGVELPGALKENRLFLVNANGNPEEALITLARKENTEIEESGCNPLFLSLGAIKWFDNEHAASAGKAFFVAPLLLIPVTLPRRRSGEFFSLSIDFDGLQFNTTAFEYFKEFFDLDFSEFNDLLSDKSKPLDLRKVYNTIRSKITPMKGWALLDNLCSLSLFSFAHFVMWSDMKNYRNVFLQNQVVSSLVEGKQEWSNAKARRDPPNDRSANQTARFSDPFKCRFLANPSYFRCRSGRILCFGWPSGNRQISDDCQHDRQCHVPW